MSSEILSVLEYMEKEKGISREDMIATISTAIRNAALKGVNAGQELKVEINPKNGSLQAWSIMRVVDSVADSATEIHIEKARLYNKEAGVGDYIEKEIDPAYLGRIAAQTARQAIMQRIRQFEKERIYEDFKDVVGDIVTGTVRRRERGDLIIDIGRAEAVLRPRERIPGEDYAPGERIRCLLVGIDTTPRGPELVLSRSSINFVRRLFELEVAEIADGTVLLQGMVREAGYRTKVAVETNDSKVDPVGACVGARGARVKSIVRELGGEKIDIIRYFEDPEMMLAEAIKPAIPRNLQLDEAQHRIYFEVAEEDLSIAIGRRGQNAKLVSRLLGWRLEIAKEKQRIQGFDDRREAAVRALQQRLGISVEKSAILVDSGLASLDAFEGVDAADLVDMGLSEDEAATVIEKVSTAQN